MESGVEVLFVGSVLYEVLLPSFVAGMISFQVAASMGIPYFHSPIHFTPVFSESFLIDVLMAGIFFGLCSFALVEILRCGRRLADRIPWSLPWKGLVRGSALIILTFIFDDPVKSGQNYGCVKSSPAPSGTRRAKPEE